MSIKAPGIGKTVANQIRGNLGVNFGGKNGRPQLAHMGIGAGQSGGMNTTGTGRAPAINFHPRTPVNHVAPTGPTIPAVAAPHFLPKPTVGAATGHGLRPTYHYIQRNGQRALVNVAHMTPAEKATIGGVGATPGVAAPVASTPASDAAPGPLDYRQNSAYISGVGALNLDVGNQEADLQDQLFNNSRQYDSAMRQAKDDTQHGFEQDSNNLNHAGLLNSGAHEQANTDRFKSANDIMAHIEENYGATASQKINDAIGRLHQYQTQQQAGLEAQAQQDYGTTNQAAPLELPTPADPAVSASVSKPAEKPLRFYASNGKGGYKITSLAPSKMTPAQLKAAKASPLNK